MWWSRLSIDSNNQQSYRISSFDSYIWFEDIVTSVLPWLGYEMIHIKHIHWLCTICCVKYKPPIHLDASQGTWWRQMGTGRSCCSVNCPKKCGTRRFMMNNDHIFCKLLYGLKRNPQTSRDTFEFASHGLSLEMCGKMLQVFQQFLY